MRKGVIAATGASLALAMSVLVPAAPGAGAATTKVTAARASAAAAKTVRIPAYVTAYTWWDNTPPRSARISHPVLHRQAGGRGTYGNPVTVAVGHSIIRGRDILDYRPGTRFYFPHLRIYGIVEDTCGSGPRPQDGSCHRLDTPGHSAPRGARTWVDIWINGRNVSARRAAIRASNVTGVHTMLINPPRGLPVRRTPLG